MNLKSIFNNISVRSFLPNKARNYRIIFSYTYNKPIGTTLFNYNAALKDLSTIHETYNSECDCATKYSTFVYSPHGHVHTGNRDIIENEELKLLMKKGAKFRETPWYSKGKIISVIISALEHFRHKLSNKCKLPEASFNHWYDILCCKIKYKIHQIYDENMFSNEVLNDPDVAMYVNHLHSRFVIVPVDKAANNFAIICKQFYFDTIKAELGITDEGTFGNSVYDPVQSTIDDICKQHSKFLKSLNIRLTENNCHIPYLYWTSKQHKNPYKFRFIAGASKSTTKQISVELSLGLKCIKEQFKRYCNVIYRRTGISYFWSIDNSLEVVDKQRIV